ncbi:MAG: family 20 glycosylhydrolase, partial [Gemmatimonadota bacterium]|nr:family 20 glycosylhydrolase [Gemmatimonadota bacterium]
MLIPGSGAGASRLGNTLEVLPRPLEFAASDSSFTVAAGTALVLYGTTGGGDRFAAGEFNAWLDELGYRALDVKIAGDFEDLPTAAGSILVGAPEAGSRMEGFLSEAGVEIDPPLKDEEYLIVVRASGAAVAARTAAGRFYGLMTLAQMFRKKVDTTLLPGGVLRDKPALALRGISDDISRGQVSTLDDLKAVVRFLARYKINVYMPYMEDMFAFRSHPGFGDGRGALTAAEVKELEDFARPLHVRIIPIFQTLGHYENLLLEPEYRHLAEFPGAHCLSPAQEETYTFLGEVLGEIVPAFSDRYFHIACDESWDVGRGKSRELVRKLGTSGAHAAHYRKVYDMVTGMDRRVMMYGDIILRNPSIMSKIPRDIVIVDWHYSGAKYPSVKKFRDAGFDVVVSPGLSNWSRVYPAFNSAMSNIERLTREGIDKGALGAVTSSWCDYGAANLRQNNLWGYAFAAQCAWSPGKANRREVERIFWKNFFGVEKAGSFVRLNGLLVASAARGSTVNDLWRHPLMGASKRGGAGPSPVKRGEDILKKMEKAREILASAQTTVRANRDYLDLLLFNVEMAELLGRKYIWMGSYKRDRKASLPPEKAASLAADAGEMVRTYGAVRKRFEDIWLKYNRPEGLENNLRL